MTTIYSAEQNMQPTQSVIEMTCATGSHPMHCASVLSPRLANCNRHALESRLPPACIQPRAYVILFTHVALAMATLCVLLLAWEFAWLIPLLWTGAWLVNTGVTMMLMDRRDLGLCSTIHIVGTRTLLDMFTFGIYSLYGAHGYTRYHGYHQVSIDDKSDWDQALAAKQQELIECDEIIAQLEQDNTALRETNAELRTTNAALIERLEKSEKANAALMKTNAEQSARITNLEQEIKDLKKLFQQKNKHEHAQ